MFNISSIFILVFDDFCTVQNFSDTMHWQSRNIYKCGASSVRSSQGLRPNDKMTATSQGVAAKEPHRINFQGGVANAPIASRARRVIPTRYNDSKESGGY